MMIPAGLHLLSEHRRDFSGVIARYRPYFVIAGLCLFTGVLLLASDFVDAEGLIVWGAVIVIVAGAMILVPALLGYARSVKRVSVFEEGIAWGEWLNQEYHSWDDLREVYRAEKRLNLFVRRAEMTLVFKGKAPVVLDQGLADFFAMAALVEAIATERLLPQYRSMLDQDGQAGFGPIVLKREGIRINDCDLEWAAVTECAIRGNGLAVTFHDDGVLVEETAMFDTIPNYLILLRLLKELGQTN